MDRAGAVFVGRRDELAELRAGLEDVAAGRGRFFLVLGEAGIGKTRLVEELAGAAADRNAVVLWGRCWEGAGAPPYWPWLQVIRSYLRTVEARPLDAVVGPGALYLAQLVPELGEQLRTSPQDIAWDSEHARFYLFDTVTSFFARAAERTPLVLAFDDLQWADLPSLLLLQFVARGVRETRLLLVGTCREVEGREMPAVAEILGALGRDAHHVPLRGLREEDVRRFIEETTGQSPAPEVVRAVHRETEGNPFFVDEVVRLLLAEGMLGRHEEIALGKLPVPQGVREAIRRRLARLPPSCRDALTRASVLGRQFELYCLQRTCGLDGDVLLETLAPALAAGVIVQEPGAAGRYRFAHALIRETLYEELASAERARLHARIGEVLEDLHQTDPTRDPAELAHHFLQAVPVGYAEQAVTYSTRAGRQAAASLAYEAAAAHFRAALEALAPTGRPDERARLLLERGDAQWKSGDGRGARETFAKAAEIARGIGDADMLARSALGFAGEGSRLLWARSGVVDHGRIGLLEEALVGLGDRDPALRARLLARLAINLYWAPQRERSLDLSDQAVALAREVGDRRVLAAVLRARWVALWRPEATKERGRIADEVVTLGEEIGDRELVLAGRRFRIVGFLEQGDVAAADREIDAWAQIAAELRQPLHMADLAMWRATRAIMDGRFADAETQANRVVELSEQESDAEPVMRYVTQMIVLHFHCGRLEDDRGWTDIPPEVPAPKLLCCERAFVANETGRAAEAARDLAALAREGFALPRDGGWIVGMSLLSAVAAELDDRDHAAQLYELLLPYADRVGIAGAGLACWGSVSHYLGLLASTLGRVAEARRHFAAAAAMHERMGARAFLAWTELALARALLRHDGGGHGAATPLLTRALATARELGMDGLLAKVRRLGLDPEPTVASLEGTDREAVFRREGDFWTVAYAGKAVRVRHGKGLGDIAMLLGNPGRQIHVADLIAASPTAPSGSGATELVAEGLRVSRGDSADAVLDPRARADYRARLGDLRRELDEAERCHDEGRTARARTELDFIAGELASALGLGGRSRRAASPIERARKAVASRIRFSVMHIARVHPELARHLQRYIRTGTLCIYVLPDEPVRWNV